MRRTLRHRLAVPAAAALMALLSAPVALACPDCATAKVVRASVFDDGFWPNLMMISLPLLVLGAISTRLYRIGSERPPQASSATQEEVTI
jgi:hypothetical protein